MTYAELLTIRERIDGHQYDSDDVTQRTIDAMMAEDVLPQAPCRELLRMVADEKSPEKTRSPNTISEPSVP